MRMYNKSTMEEKKPTVIYRENKKSLVKGKTY
jgi:hypothetical protein